jgi:hypothetical protein
MWTRKINNMSNKLICDFCGKTIKNIESCLSTNNYNYSGTSVNRLDFCCFDHLIKCHNGEIYSQTKKSNKESK